ncbi:MAG: DUF177 domain-containing protein [bacterium]
MEAVEFHWVEPAGALGLELEPPYRYPIAIDLSARRFGTRVVVTGRVGCRVRLECSRCLESFEGRVESDVVIECLEGIRPERREDEVRDDDADAVWYEAPFVDLTDELRQIVLVASPDYPVCREECRGLCSGCGANLNNDACACQGAGTAKPFEPLGAVLHAMKEQQRHG